MKTPTEKLKERAIHLKTSLNTKFELLSSSDFENKHKLHSDIENIQIKITVFLKYVDDADVTKATLDEFEVKIKELELSVFKLPIPLLTHSEKKYLQ